MSNDKDSAVLGAIADKLINQQDEPLGCDTERLHYWRDKAITAANDIAALLQPTQSDALLTNEYEATTTKESDAPPEDGEKLLQDYDNALSTSFRLHGFHTGHGIGKIASHLERFEQAAIIKDARDKLLAALKRQSK